MVVVCVTKTERGNTDGEKNGQTARAISESGRTGAGRGRYTAGVDPETGKPIAKSVLARTQRECKEKLQKGDGRTRKDRNHEATRLHGGRMGAALVRELRKAIRPRIHGDILQELHRPAYRAAHRGDIKLTALTTLQIQKFYNETKAHGRVQRYENMDDLSLSNKTIRGLHTMLRQCLEQAVTERLIPYNPQTAAACPKKRRRKCRSSRRRRFGIT